MQAYKNYLEILGKFWIRGFIVKWRHDLVSVMAVFHYPEFIEKQTVHNRQLSNFTVPFVPQDKADGDSSEILRTSVSKLHSLSY